MAKGAGSTRNNTSKSFQWSGIDDFEHVLHDSQEIFKIYLQVYTTDLRQQRELIFILIKIKFLWMLSGQEWPRP